MDVAVTDFIGRHWGKAQPADKGGPAWHPLAYHALDVAACMAALLDAWPWVLDRIAAPAGLAPEVARRWLIAVASLHDLGKYACAFQRKADDLWFVRDQWPAGRALPEPTGFDHGAFAAEVWEAIDGAKMLGVEAADTSERFRRWLACAWSHHGRPAPAVWPGFERRVYMSDTSLAAARGFVGGVRDLLDIDERSTVALPETVENGGRPPTETWLVAGLCILADWLGSNQRWFAYQAPTRDLAGYWPHARTQAAKAVREAGLLRAPPRPALSLHDLLPEAGAASPLQQAALDLPLGDGPALFVLEDLTGAGKTEAALLLAHRLMLAGRANGLYWALPTKATANMLFTRLSKAYRALFADSPPPTLTLAHDAVDLHPDFARIAFEGADDSGYGGDNRSASAQSLAWLYDDRRKTFLSQVGVGTIDQALLGVLNRRFHTLRLAGLAGQLLIIDEVHSFDAYTTQLIKALLAFQAGLGGSAILLSATLTRETKTQLMQAFDLGRMGSGCSQVKALDDAFPMISRLDAGGLVEQPVQSARGTRRDLPVVRLDSAEAAQALLVEAARSGRCGVWVRNTVQDAIDAFTALQAEAPDIGLHLFHARFTRADRARIEDDVVGRFGKARSTDGRAGQLVIATQVVEQSLDLDFDVMVSDLAPFDLLVQRAGRLHRHARPEPRPAPALHVLAPPPDQVEDAAWFSRLLPRGARVYDNHAQLWSSLTVACDGLNLASANPRLLLERALDSDAAPAPLQRSADLAQGMASAHRSAAGSAALAVGDGFAAPTQACCIDDGIMGTRLSEESVVLRLACWDGTTLAPLGAGAGVSDARAWRLSEVQIPRRQATGVPLPECEALRAALAAARAGWPRGLAERDDLLLVPMELSAAGNWQGAVLADRDRRRPFSYSSSTGLNFTL